MKRPTDRRTVLMAAGAAAFAAATGTAAAQSDINGAVTFAGGFVIPQGQIEIYLEDPAIQDRVQRRIAETRVSSDGGSKTIGFSLTPPANSTASPTLQIVVRLERADGWLLARGSAQHSANAPVSVTLNEVIY
jgi:uncharacterized lipoprotein YbaY